MPDIHEIGRLITTIPQDTARAELPALLSPILKQLALLDDATQTAILHHEIKSYFGLTSADIKAYERLLKSFIPVPSAEEEEDGIHTKSLIDNLLYWTKDSKGVVKYLLYDNGSMKLIPTCEIDGRTCRPKQDIGFLLPDESIIDRPYPYNPVKLLKDIEYFIYSHLQLPGDENYLILALFVLHSWIIEKFDTTTMLYFYGTAETGKSRAGQVLNELVYKSEHITSPTEAVLFRKAHFFQGSLVLDEIKLLGLDGNKAVESLLKSRYKRGINVSRINTNIKNSEDQIENFDVFGPTIMCTTEGIDNIIGSRCIKFVMTKNSRREVEKPIDKETAATLREQLLYFRKELYLTALPVVDAPLARRNGEIVMGMYQTLLLVDPLRLDEFKIFLDKLEAAQKEENADTFEADIVKIILIESKDKPHFFSKDIALKLNADLKADDKFRHNTRTIGRKISKLGFKTLKLHGQRAWITDTALISQLCEHFDISQEETIKEQQQNIPF
jgi:hypothetical protein